MFPLLLGCDYNPPVNYTPVIETDTHQLLTFYDAAIDSADIIAILSVFKAILMLFTLIIMISNCLLISLEKLLKFRGENTTLDTETFCGMILRFLHAMYATCWKLLALFFGQGALLGSTRVCEFLTFMFIVYRFILFAHITSLVSTNLVVTKPPNVVNVIEDLEKPEFLSYKLMMRKNDVCFLGSIEKTQASWADLIRRRLKIQG